MTSSQIHRSTMRAAVLDGPGPPEALAVREVPMPAARPGWVLIEVKAFGINRSELYTREGDSPGVEFPRILGIEATGVVVDAPGGEFLPGQQVVTLMGGMGRHFDGGYAEYTVVPASQVIPFTSTLPWSTLGAIPEMLQTAYGSLTVGLDVQRGQSLLIRGGTSSVGLAAAAIAKSLGVTVISTTRRADRTEALQSVGADHVIVDDGEIAGAVRELIPGGVDAAIELVGVDTMIDTLRATRVHGTVCFTGMLSGRWTIQDWYPMDYIPNGVRLTAYSGGSADLTPRVLQDFLDNVAAGQISVPIHRIYPLDEIADAHRDMSEGKATGKLVVLPRPID